MASTLQLTFSPFLSLSKNPIRKPQKLASFVQKTQRMVTIRATGDGGPDMVGDFGARDPFPAEIASNFADKVLGNVDTEHKILIPIASALSLATQECVPVSELQQTMAEDEAKRILLKVPGWRLVREEGALKLQGLWKLRDKKCAEEFIDRINRAVVSTGHLPLLNLEEPKQVRAELWTSEIGGLSMNDFIVAAKIDGVKVSDLLQRQRVWA